MSDEFLKDLHEAPRAEFASGLEARLHAIDAESGEEASRPAPWRRFAPALGATALAATLALAFTLEPVRATAREFLDLFRVKRFAAVPVDPERLARLARGGLDLRSLVGEQVEVVVPPREPEAVSSPEAGGVLAGIEAALPSSLPPRTELVETRLLRPGRFRVRLDAEKLQALAQAAAAEEIEIPAHWSGATLDVDAPPVVAARYERTTDAAVDGRPARQDDFVLLQSATPQVELPEGVELDTLGRLGLRLAGMSAEEAASFADAVDWRSTLLVPVPVQGGTFREVEVAGRPGLLVIVEPPRNAPADASGRRPRASALVLWSTGDRVLALRGPAARGGLDVLEMAQSVR